MIQLEHIILCNRGMIGGQHLDFDGYGGRLVPVLEGVCAGKAEVWGPMGHRAVAIVEDPAMVGPGRCHRP